MQYILFIHLQRERERERNAYVIYVGKVVVCIAYCYWYQQVKYVDPIEKLSEPGE